MSTKLEKLSHYAVIIIALSALVVSITQTRIQQKHNKLTVKPYLGYSLNQSFDDDLLTVYITNDGFGPAIVDKIIFIYNGKTYKTLEDYLKASGESKNRRGSYNYNKNSVFRSNEKNLLVSLKGLKHRGVTVKIYYKSIYQEKGELTFTF
ncbi:hypothetical protein [Tenacibaculum amylolyticum]|uniref:hypothetical protein n=1 Tax=Tenacibaculum amylolyticum TaxID=104269 RepID=UPI0038943E68